MDRPRRTHCMASMKARLSFSGLLHMGTLKTPCVQLLILFGTSDMFENTDIVFFYGLKFLIYMFSVLCDVQ
jgi:hypothetical protein